MLHTYTTAFKTFDPDTNEFIDDSMEWEAEDEMHAVNQLLDFYRTLRERVAVIESVTKH